MEPLADFLHFLVDVTSQTIHLDLNVVRIHLGLVFFDLLLPVRLHFFEIGWWIR
ncbi:hypothetical protein D3C80_2212460 [compost metagenome]